MRVATEADVFLAIGSTLHVYPIADTVRIASEAGARVAIINAQPTPFDGLADVVLNASIGEVLPRLVAIQP
jgi:NAD-dependent deacetylase